MELDHVVGEIAAPIARVWALMADVGGVGRLVPAGGIPGMPAVESVSVEGAGQGAVRTVVFAGGLTMRERFDLVDVASHTIVYVALPPMPLPITDYRATIALTSLGAAQTRVVWSSTGEPNGASLEDVRAMLETLYNALIDGARQVCSAGA
jgi:hypothetical protein